MKNLPRSRLIMGLRSGIKVRASRLDEKSLNYGQLNAALVGAVKSLEMAVENEGGRQRQDGLRVANGEGGPKLPGKAFGR